MATVLLYLYDFNYENKNFIVSLLILTSFLLCSLWFLTSNNFIKNNRKTSKFNQEYIFVISFLCQNRMRKLTANSLRNAFTARININTMLVFLAKLSKSNDKLWTYGQIKENTVQMDIICSLLILYRYDNIPFFIFIVFPRNTKCRCFSVHHAKKGWETLR